jgi:GNAT superfamily N-acetyltransferase
MTAPAVAGADRVRLLDTLGANAWPAATSVPVGGWVCRFTQGITRRANSVWAREWRDGQDLDQAVAEAVRLYGARGQDPIFQISPASCPPELDDALAAAGCAYEAPTDVMTAATAEVMAILEPGHDVTLLERADDRWMSGYMPGRWRSGEGEVRRGIIDRIAPARIFALAQNGKSTSGVGMAVCEQGWAGIFNMHTVEACRGQGIASAILHRFAAWAQAQGAASLYLQVEQDNPAAIGLYKKAGFRHLYTYHYRRGSQIVDELA